ncbi:YjgP/YjgQ family permease [Marinilabiliaceae bacterium JC017]|nr:YjgP/YjgQ family permease [Marinilabiliaceae bacterium JC017]
MKKLYLFILKSYAGPLVMTFFIALFILVMQFLWQYVDDMVGKGLEFLVLGELLFYAAVQVIPMALPLAILLASLMTFGNLGENYELTAIKAAGISLPRIMMPLVILTILISIGAFWFSNNMLPVANLKMYSLLWDVKQAKPELDIKEKVFYDGIENFSIKIDEKDKESNMLYDIMIYDHRDQVNKNSNVTLADSGHLQFSEDKKYMMLTLFNGVRYDEKATMEKRRLRDRDIQMFRKDRFKEQITLVEMEGYDFSRTDEDLFKSNYKMKNMAQLQNDEDTLWMERSQYIDEISRTTKNSYFVKGRYAHRKKNKDNSYAIIDSVAAINIDSLFATYRPEQQMMTMQGALRQAKDSKRLVEEKIIPVNQKENFIRRHQMEWHRKFTLSFACFIFFFIGAPLGAIIRKGGLGMPVVISILFFIVYYIIDTMGAKMAREGVWIVYQGMWLSSFVLLPIGIFLTYKSATDSSLLNADAYRIFFRKLFKRDKHDLVEKDKS